MTPEDLAAVMEATWPAARVWREGPFLCRDGAGGGKRVSAASSAGDWTEADLDALDQGLVLVREGETALDRALAARGWRVVDPVVAYAAPVAELRADLPPLSTFPHWAPLEIVRTIWAEGGIGPERVAVMERAAGKHTAILARHADRPAGAAFVALHGKEAMLHALEVRESLRRSGVGANLLRAAANWAAAEGATRLSLVVTERNTAARALYARLGLRNVGQYHYRMK
ncbi:GNAT family N-acetyltransferase [Tabrizicola sp.]|uniref:GNAT family N-acetyltransferase n=1 Tax=Tabrizicola sp. TaxID=2005166 RepID=UPI0035B2B81E